MKSSLIPVFILSLGGALALTGCSGVGSIPDTILPGAQVSPGAIHGSVFGGHSPIVGAEVYVLQVGATGYGTAGKSVSTNQLNTAAAYGTDPTHGGYVLTDANGAFQVSNDYTCTGPTTSPVAPGEPVYLASVGGTTNVGSFLMQITSSFVSSSISRGTTTYTIFFGTTLNAIPSGSVYFNSGAFTTTSGYSFLNGTTQTILAGSGANNGFAITETTNAVTTDSTLAGYALALEGGAVNPAITNIAVLGNCPGTSGEFSSLSYVYMDEVSTAATANALAGFGTGPFNIGAPSTNLQGIANAALTAGQLYNIQTGGGAAGIGALQNTKNSTTPANASNGVPSYQTLNTLGNILAACVDSAGTETCTSLFDYSTSNGIPSGKTGAGTVPADTATAAFYIAQNPAGAAAYSTGTTGVPAELCKIQGAETTVPYGPALACSTSAPPNSFIVSIAYSGGGLGATNGTSPHSVAVDNVGNIYTVKYATTGVLSIFSPLGVPLSTTGFTGNGLDDPDSVAVDSASNYVWIANYGSTNLSRFETSGTAEDDYSIGTGKNDITDAEIDGSGNIWAVTDSTTNYLVKLSSAGAVETGGGTTDLYTPQSLAIEPTTGYIWIANGAGHNQGIGGTTYYATKYAATTASDYNKGGIQIASGTAIDNSGNIWFANNNGTVTALTSAGAAVTNSPFTPGTSTAALDGVAIDGSGSVWVTNNSAGAIYELTNAGVAVSPSAGYTATSPDGIAIDGSGNVWYSTSASGTLYELVGQATPVVTPISLAVKNSTLGEEP